MQPSAQPASAAGVDLEALAAASAERIRSGQLERAAAKLEAQAAATAAANRVGGAFGTTLLGAWRAATEALGRLLGGGGK